MSAPTVFLSAATDDLESLRNVLHGAFSRAGFRVFTQKHSLGSAPGTLREYLVGHIDQSDCVIHLAGIAYGSDADEPFADAPAFQCSWTQFEYYYAHQQGRKVIAFVCAPNLSARGFIEKGADAADITRKQALQEQHRQRVASGEFSGTPLDGRVKRTLNEGVNSMESLLQAIAAAVASVQGLAGAHTAEISLQPGLHTLPPPPDGFVGRETDLAALRAVNPAAGAVLTGLKGMGGIGKTALAVVLAHEWLPRFPDAQLFLDARGTQASPPGAGDLIAQVIQTFHPTAKLPDDLDALKHIYHDVLHGKKVLILLDNARDAAQAAPLIPPAGCALIVTSRQNFMLGKSAAHNVGRLPDDQAAALLREYHPALGDADAAALVRLCAGLPLALRLAGAHLALDAAERDGQPNVAAYVNALRGGRLGALDKDAPDAGVITVSETLRLSEDQLPPAEREVWRCLGVFTASFDERAAQAVAGADEPMLARFVRRSLLEREGAERFKLHDLAADYARAQHTEAGLDALHLAHARHYAKVGWEADALYKEKGKTAEGLALFDRERAQIEAAFEWLSARSSRRKEAQSSPLAPPRPSLLTSAATEAATVLLNLVDAVVHTGQELRFHPRQRITWVEAQLAAARLTKNRQQEGNALGNLGIAHAALGDARKAIEFHEQALVISREIGDRRGEGNALGNLGNAHYSLGDAHKAIEYYKHCLVLHREIGNRRQEGTALGCLGLAYYSLGDARKAIEFHEQHLAIAREIGDRYGEGNALCNLGLAYYHLGDARKAIEFYEQALAISREIGDRRGEGMALGNLGNAHAELGDARKAIGFYEQQLTIAREIGDRRGEGNALWNSALAFWELGERPEAIARAETVLCLFEAIEDPNAAMVRTELAEWRAEM